MAGQAQATPSILVVDDHAETVDVLRLFLEMYGYAVRTALSVKEALQAVHERVPDLVMTDYSMPDMTGLALCRILRQDPATSEMPVILFTAWEGLREDNTPFDRVISKPADLDLILAQIEALLRPVPGTPRVRRLRPEPILSLR
jgi:CheY-like chemotaxis protein